MNIQQLKDQINQIVRENQSEEITAVLMNGLLHSIVDYTRQANDFNSNVGEVEIGTYTKSDNSTTPICQLCFESAAADMQLNTPWQGYVSINITELQNISVLSSEIWVSDGVHGYASLIGSGRVTFYWQGAQSAVKGRITYIKL